MIRHLEARYLLGNITDGGDKVQETSLVVVRRRRRHENTTTRWNLVIKHRFPQLHSATDPEMIRVIGQISKIIGGG